MVARLEMEITPGNSAEHEAHAKAVDRVERRLKRERRARAEAELLLEDKSRELYLANTKLSSINHDLEERVKERTLELEAERQHALDLARIDPLTQLANRRYFSSAISRMAAEAIEHETTLTLFLLDLDGFKSVNDLYGHDAGDFALVEVSNFFRSHCQSHDFIARLGGDEFAIISPEFADIDEAQEYAEDLIAELPVPLLYKGHKLDFGVSIGIAALPTHCKDDERLQRYADLAMYKAKDLGRGTSVLFETGMAEARRKRVQLRVDLDLAITNQEVSIFFQPTMRPKADKPVGAEALLRWEHSTYGWIPPLEILSLADDVDFPQSLTRYILEQSLIQAKPYLASGSIEWVSINLVDKDLRDLTLPDFILDLLHTLEIPSHHLKIEITEHNAISDFQNATRIMNNLKTEGIVFAIDDFGAGYSNMLTLDRLPFKVLKIDQSLIDRIAKEEETKTMVRAIIEMAHALEMEVVAEGVENSVQEHLLSELKCDYLQGFSLGLPKPIAEALPASLPLIMK